MAVESSEQNSFSAFNLGRSYNINKLAEQAVEDVLKIGMIRKKYDCAEGTFSFRATFVMADILCPHTGKAKTGLDIPLYEDFIRDGEFKRV